MDEPFDPYYNQQISSGADHQAAHVLIETSEALTITQDLQMSGVRTFQAPESANLSVYGDVVRIAGPIRAPGRQITIFARRLEAVPDSQGRQSALSVDGLPGKLPDQPEPRSDQPPPPGKNAVREYHRIGSNEYSPAEAGQSAASHPEMNGKPGNHGAKGNPAGSITIFCGEFIADTFFEMSARGGRGGDGQKGQNGQDGGDGGKGAGAFRGGWFDTNWPAEDGAPGGDGGSGGRGGQGGQGGDGGQITFLSLLCNESSVVFSVDGGEGGQPGEGGAGGVHGSGGHGGDGFEYRGRRFPEQMPGGDYGPDGKDGVSLGKGEPAPFSVDGVKTIVFASNYPDLAAIARIHPLQMSYERLRTLYLTADPADRESENVKEVGALIGWLSGILENFPSGAEGAPIAQAMAASVSGLRHNLRLKLDFYGHEPGWVPLASMDEYDRALGDKTGGSLGLLQETEKVWDNYRKAVNQSTEAREQLTGALNAAQRHHTSLEAKIEKARDDLASLGADFPARDRRVQAAKQALNEAIDRFKLDIDVTSGLTLTKLLDVMESLAFLPEEASFQRYSMIASQAGKIYESVMEDVPTDEGDTIKKAYVIHRLDVMKRGVEDLDEGYAIHQGYVESNDPDGYKLLYQREKFNELLDNFYDSHPQARQAEQAMNDYVREVQIRNRKILEYNKHLARYMDLLGQSKLLALQVDRAQAELAKTTGNWPAHQLFIDALYRRNLEECIRELYMAGRAYTFWSLQEYDVYKDLLGSGEGVQIDFLALSQGKQAILSNHMQDIEALAGDLATRKDPVVFEYTRDCHPEDFARLQDGEAVEFSIDAVQTDTREEDSPFAPFANVRLLEVRCWAHGLKTENPNHIIHLTHLGDEEIVDPAGTIVALQHAEVHKTFEYKPSAGLRTGQAVQAHAYFWGQEESIVPGSLPKHTPVGPFGTWRVEIRPEEHIAPAWDQLDKLVLEFYIKYEGFVR